MFCREIFIYATFLFLNIQGERKVGVNQSTYCLMHRTISVGHLRTNFNQLVPIQTNQYLQDLLVPS